MDLELKNLFFSYNPDLSTDNYTLKNISLSLVRGEFTVISGRSGSGKTTLAQIIAGILKPTSGALFYNSISAANTSFKALKKNIGMIFQTPEEQLFERTVFEDVTFVLRRDAILTDDEISEKAKITLKLVGLNYDEYKDRLSFNLSSGEKRKAATACILINSPSLIILDEPTVGLDHATKKSLIKTIKTLKDEGKTIICITHDLNSFLDISDKIVILKNGEIIFSGDKTTIFDDFEIINNNVKLSVTFSLLHELKKIDNCFKIDNIYSRDDAVSYIKSLID